MPTAIDTYRRESMLSSSPGEVLLRVYEGLLRRIEAASAAMDRGDAEAGARSTTQAMELLAALQSALDPEISTELTAPLNQLYGTVGHWLLEANLRQDPAPLRQALRVLRILEEGWRGAVEQAA